jgi:hypothetical protein
VHANDRESFIEELLELLDALYAQTGRGDPELEQIIQRLAPSWSVRGSTLALAA